MASVVLWLGNIFTVITFVMALIIIILAYTLNFKINGISFKIADLKNAEIDINGTKFTFDTESLITKTIVVCALSFAVVLFVNIFGNSTQNKKLIGLFTILLLIGLFISVVLLFIETTKIDSKGIDQLKLPLQILKYSQWGVCGSSALGVVFIGMSSLYKLL